MTGEIILMPGASSRFLPLYRPDRIAAKLHPLVVRKDWQAATRWWTLHVWRVRQGMAKKRVPAALRDLIIKEITGQVRLELLALGAPVVVAQKPKAGGDVA